MKIELKHIDLSPRQIKLANLYRQAYGKIVLIKHKDKYRVINPKDVEVF